MEMPWILLKVTAKLLLVFCLYSIDAGWLHPGHLLGSSYS